MDSKNQSAGLDSVFSDLVRVQIEIWAAVDARLRDESDLTVARWQVMRSIAAHDDCRVGDIADDLGVTVGGASKVVDRIEDAGHCTRRANPVDRRSSIVALTASGGEALGAASAAADAVLRDRLAGPLGADRLTALSHDLATLRASATASASRSASGDEAASSAAAEVSA
ncbi:MAG: hypothetical protein RI885_1856 [Actinomycetota bacterium]|jgi:DNA-binding MarR family transcriptional regulator